mmetsp:Transcript_1334/g.3172  ORF Transcript_1334/g.3172 Transcript_1334/m.3172 type:complete len:215 (-) Transcript_1334:2982-3626(-)
MEAGGSDTLAQNLFHRLSFSALTPHVSRFGKIFAAYWSGVYSSAGQLENVIGWVFASWTLVAVTSKVLEQCGKVFSQVTKVHHLTTTLQQQEMSEKAKDLGRRLMNGTDDGSTRRGSFLHTTHHVHRTHGIEARSGFIQEEQRWVRSQLNTDGHTLAFLGRQTISNGSDLTITNHIQLEHMQRLTSMSKFLLTSPLRWETSQSSKVQSLFDSLS